MLNGYLVKTGSTALLTALLTHMPSRYCIPGGHDITLMQEPARIVCPGGQFAFISQTPDVISKPGAQALTGMGLLTQIPPSRCVPVGQGAEFIHLPSSICSPAGQARLISQPPILLSNPCAHCATACPCEPSMATKSSRPTKAKTLAPRFIRDHPLANSRRIPRKSGWQRWDIGAKRSSELRPIWYAYVKFCNFECGRRKPTAKLGRGLA